MISFLITLLLAAVVVYVIKLFLDMVPLPPPVKTIAWLIVGIFILIWFLNFLGIYTGDMGARPLFR